MLLIDIIKRLFDEITAGSGKTFLHKGRLLFHGKIRIVN